MKRSLLERAKLARRISETPPDPSWEQFRRDWTAFNAIYTGTKRSGDSEDGMVNRAILKFFDDADASACLNDIPADAVKALLRLPPGDDRFTPADPKYRAKTKALAAVYASGATASEKLSALMRVVYQVRSNMIHGEKDPDFWRDKSLVAACAPITNMFIRHLTKILGA